MRYLRVTAAWLVAALITSASASLVSTQYVISALVDVGANINFEQRLSMIVADLGILATLFPIVAIGFLFGFIAAAMCVKRLPGKRQHWYPLAGACSVASALLLMNWVLNLMPVAGARTLTGMFLISFCGALGGLLFSRFTNFTQTLNSSTGKSPCQKDHI